MHLFPGDIVKFHGKTHSISELGLVLRKLDGWSDLYQIYLFRLNKKVYTQLSYCELVFSIDDY